MYDQFDLFVPDLTQICERVKSFIEAKNYEECIYLISNTMRAYPHAPHPHNLMAILLEKQGEKMAAAKHFRAARALDPAYLPSCINLARYGSFFSKGGWAYSEQDCADQYGLYKE